jgi:hypothetical protein
VDETDLTREDGAPTPRADVQFVKLSFRTPLGFRLDAETRTSAHSAADHAVALMLVIVAGTVLCGTLIGLVLLTRAPAWLALAVTAPAMVLTAAAARHVLIHRHKE